MKNKNIQMKEKDGKDWNNLFPISLNENIFNDKGINLNKQLENLNHTIENNINKNIIPELNNKKDNREMKIHYFDFSLKYSSKCIFIEHNGINILIDFGDKNHSLEAITKIKALGITKIDYAIITHYHGDHYGGIFNFLDSSIDFTECIFYLPPTPDWEKMKTIGTGGGSTPSDWENAEKEVFSLLDGKNLSRKFPIEKQWIDLNDHGKMRFYNADRSQFYRYYEDLTNDYVSWGGIDYNNFSLATEIVNGDRHFLFTGDLGITAQEVISNSIESNIHFYDVEHHGLNHGYDPNFAKQITPKIAAIQNADLENSYYSRGMYGYLLNQGAEIYITAKNGDITFIDTVEGTEVTTTKDKGNAKIGISQSYQLAGGHTVLKKGTHLDNVTKAGTYMVRSRADLEGLQGIPDNDEEKVDSGFKLVVEYFHDEIRLRQTIYENSGRGYIWYRVYSTNNQWNPWFRLMRTIDLTPEQEPDGVGKYIEQGTDLNDLKKLGKYSAATNIVGQSIINKPQEVETGFTLEVYPLHAKERFYQILKTTNPNTDEYTRVYGTSGFGPWNKVTKTRVE